MAGTFAGTAGRDAHLRRWNAAHDGYPLLDSVVAHMYAINHLAFQWRWALPGQRAALDKSIKLWDPTSLALLRVLDKASGPPATARR